MTRSGVALPAPRTRRLLAGLAAALLATLLATSGGAGIARAGAADAATDAAAAAALPYQDPTLPVDARVTDLLGRMSLDDKLGQLVQAERGEITPAQLAADRVGSVLSGGGSAPASNTAAGWADMVDAYQRSALGTPLGIPMIYGIDAVHGHNNVRGATIFPHNIGLGATRNPALVQRIGRATAEELTGTGIPWDFAPCLCVARDDRWGRTYESFGEVPDLPASMTTVITGLQGDTLGGAPASVLATAKHFLGDGGTTGGKDQGDTQLTEAQLRAIHLPPFTEAVRRGVGSVMVSFSSWNGSKVHGNRYLITDLLKGELGFRGFVVSDWAGIDQIDGASGFSALDIRTAFNAGIDMAMVPVDYRAFLSLLRSEVQAGRIPQSRVDDATRRVLTAKVRLGLFEHPYADRSYAGTLGSAAHRAIAREAVQKSQVALKNSGILPLGKAGGKIFVAGKNADDIGNQSGGWTISWQGGSGPVTPGTTILQGVRAAVGSGATVTYDAAGNGIDRTYRAAIAVIGETPYAEGNGDRPGGLGLDQADLAVLGRLKAAGVPVVAVLVSGRPLDIAAQLPDWSAAVESWLPGTEGRGVADVLFGDAPATGKLPVSWPASSSQEPVNSGDGKTPLFPFGYGLTYGTTTPTPTPPASPSPTPPASPSPTPPASPSPTPPASPSPTPPANPSPTPAPATAGCRVTYTPSQWTGGFTASVSIRNGGGTAVDGWTLRWTYAAAQRLTSAWNATVTQDGSAVTATPAGYNATIPAGGSVDFGVQGTWTGTNPTPSGFSLNGTPCATG